MKKRKRVTNKMVWVNKNRLIWPLAGLVILLAGVQLCLSYRCAGSGDQLAQLEVASERIGRENMILREENNQLGSLVSIKKQALEMGFVGAQEIVYLSAPAPVAMGL
ncbi:hypothetical protein MUP65_00030 [Patescibacteria group bacterium]|nr:hypothetical protein [Patescibacteria group bacterium]